MNLEDWKNVADIIQASVTTIALIIAGVWAYIKFVYRRENVSRAEFIVDLDFVGKQGEYWLIEISAFVENKGFIRHQVKNFKINVRYLLNDDVVVDGKEDLKFQVNIPHSINKRIEDKERYLYRDTYIDPGLRYRNSYITFIPKDATFVLVFGAFEYGKERFTGQNCSKYRRKNQQGNLLRTVRPNKRIQPTPLRVDRDRSDFEGWNRLESFPDLSVRRG